ncbi:PTS transporter subunit EIIC [Enterococcus faecium]|uniref:PTS transporter subunit EIIC n=1 Tax=Enterococcus faecium TaxID=1352 RepID=UPI001105BC73|nr:PTS transporter subunit EIIC [Enterococcus faecium]
MNYNDVAKRVIDYVGGKENINSFTHCATRLRFQLKDNKKVEAEKIKADSDLVGFVEAQGQSQIIVGTQVSKVYEALEENIDTINDESNATTDEVSDDKSIFDKILATISAIFTPYIPVLASAGIIKGLVAILNNLNLLSEKSDTYAMFTGIGNALIYFFPILLAFTAAKQFKANPYIGATIGAALMEPNIATITETGNKMNFFGITIVAQNFASTVIPIIIAMFFFAKLEHFLKKIIPANAQLILVPVLSALIIVPLTLMVFGPVGFALANAVVAVYKFLLSTNMILFQAVFGAFFIYVIMLGVHWVLLPIQLQILADQGREYSLASGGLGGYALLGVCLAVFFISRQKAEKEMAGSAAFVNALSGITEPGLYGVMMRNKKYFAAVSLGGLAGGLVHGITGTYITNFAFGGLLGIPAFLSSPKAATYFIGVIVSIIVGFISTIFLSKNDNKKVKG